jgi:hypothetical protein
MNCPHLESEDPFSAICEHQLLPEIEEDAAFPDLEVSDAFEVEDAEYERTWADPSLLILEPVPRKKVLLASQKPENKRKATRMEVHHLVGLRLNASKPAVSKAENTRNMAQLATRLTLLESLGREHFYDEEPLPVRLIVSMHDKTEQVKIQRKADEVYDRELAVWIKNECSKLRQIIMN